MKRFLGLYLIPLLLIGQAALGQGGEKVNSVNVLNMNNDTVSLPYLGEKNILIFYADPAKPGQNKDFRNYFKTHPITNPDVVSYGVVNLAAAPMLPNSLVRRKALKEIKGTNAELYFDPDNMLSSAWNLPGAQHNFTVIFINKDRIIEFYKAGQLTAQEKQEVLALINKR